MLHPDLTAEIARQRQEALRASALPRRPRHRLPRLPRVRIPVLLAPAPACATCAGPVLRPRPW